MLNSVVVVGRLYEIYDAEHILLKIPSHQKIGEDIIIKIKISRKIKETIDNVCRINDLLGIKGAFTGIFPDDELLAEKVTYLSSSHEKN